MKTPREPNLRTIDPRLVEVRQRATKWADTWQVQDTWVLCGSYGGGFNAHDSELARHICDAHNHLLPLINQLLFRQRSEADLDANPGVST